MDKKYSESIHRYRALTEEGKPCEILERITFERLAGEGEAPGEPVEVSRRYDLKTGERLVRINDTEFADDETGARLRIAQA